MKRISPLLVLSAFVLLFFTACHRQTIEIIAPTDATERILFGARQLQTRLAEAGYHVLLRQTDSIEDVLQTQTIVLVQENDSTLPKEGFHITTVGKLTRVVGRDGNGILYGCRELIDRQELPDATAHFPADFRDAPEMVLRGACIGLQKTVYLPGHNVYEYPYTPENFPWFYDKEEWIKYLDMLVANRMNSLYLWNGHPFASLVKLEEYPFALEVDEETFRKNEEMFSFLTHEAEKRGIFVIQMFYNIILSKPFADHYGLKTQDRNRPITPLVADYTRKSIAAFIEKYPNVGLLVCLGEAMSTVEDDVEWFTKTIIPGVKDGLQALGRTDEPPLLLRAHDTDCKLVVDASLPLYKNLYTMHKYNGESLTTYEPRGPWTKIHTDLSSLGSIHISNVHILANLEPFRWGAPDFVRKAVLAMHDVHGANALHLYPQASYWDWPYTADKLPAGKRQKQLERDWMWYKAWGRYAWNSRYNPEEEAIYWNRQLGKFYGMSAQEADPIRIAYEESGEIAPKLLRRFGITEGNRQTLLLGMFMSQLVNPYKYTIYPGFYESCGPEGEKLIEYVEKEWKRQPHVGELPLDIIEQVVTHADKAVAAIEKASTDVTSNKEEFARLQNDIYCCREFAHAFYWKVKAAKLVLDYQWGKETKKLEEALPLLEKSLQHYRRLAALTDTHYLYANSMQTAQRRIPIGGDDGKNKTWNELLGHYEKELENFKANLTLLTEGIGEKQATQEIASWQPAAVKLISAQTAVEVREGASLFADLPGTIEAVAPELKGLTAFRLHGGKQREEGTTVSFETAAPVKLLVAYFKDDQRRYASAPKLETDATANDYGQAEPVLTNAIRIKGLPLADVHAYHFGAGTHTLLLPKGYLQVLGFTSADTNFRNAGLAGGEETADWLFY